MFYKDYEKIGLRCHLCNLASHTIFDCPIVHFPKNKELIIKRYLFTENQSRKKFPKRPPLKLNTLQIKKNVENYAIKLRLKSFSRLNKRRKITEESQILDNGTNSEGSLSLIESLSENQEKSGLSASQLHLEEDSSENNSNDKKFEGWIQNSSPLHLNERLKGNLTCRNATGQEITNWKEEFSPKRERVGSLMMKNKRVSVVLNEKLESELTQKKKQSILNSLHQLTSTKKEVRTAPLFMMDFESLKIYSSYFPHNNITKILKQSWYSVGTLGYTRSLSQNKKAFNFWRRKKPSKRKKAANFPNKNLLRPLRIKEKKVTFF